MGATAEGMGIRILTPLIMTALMVMMSWGTLVDSVQEETNEPTVTALETVDIVLEAPSPGHVVFAEYVGGQDCPPCYNSATKSLKQLKTANTDEFVYISYIASQYAVLRTSQAGEVSPINRISHLDASGSNSAPRAYFGDCAHGSSSCYKSGSGGNNNYDSLFSGTGGMSNNMHSTVNDYTLSVAQAPNGNNVDITIEASYLGSGSKTVSVFAAVTENVCHSYPYADGSKPTHCWKKWLTNSGNNGFVQLTLSSTATSYTWSVPKSTVYNSDDSNMMTIAALQSGWSSGATRYDVYHTADSEMNPLDLSATDITITNDDSPSSGFQTGDMLTLDATITNSGTEDYSDGGSIQFYHVTGMNSEQNIGPSVALNNLNVGQTQSVSAQFNTSSVTMQDNGAETFRVRLYNTVGEKIPVGNNQKDGSISHDVAPSASRPIATGQSQIARGDSLDFEVSGLSNDQVDSMGTMSAEMQTSVANLDTWSGDWVSGGTLMGEGTGNERFVFTVSPPSTAASGNYDVRARLVDARGSIGDWSQVSDNAFNLMNGLPMVVDPTQPGEIPANCPNYPGQPSVKVEMIERIDLAGLVCDAETPLNELVITSNNPAFRQWDAATGEIEVQFDQVITNPTGEVVAQPMQLSISDGEESNSGTLSIMVIENGAPRWASLPPQSFNEGGSTSLILTPYLSDTSSDGTSVSPMALSVSIVDVGNSSLIYGDINGHTINIDVVDENAFGSTLMIIRASDSDGQFTDTQLVVHIGNINDAPTLDVTDFNGLRMKIGEEFNFDVIGNMADVDDSVDAMFVTVNSDTWKIGSRYNPLSGAITAWFEEPGTHTLTIVVSDVHDAATAYDVTVEIIESIPLVWSDNPETGDIMAEGFNIYVGEEPSFTVSHHGDAVLTNVEIIWTICNIDTGVCTDFGTEDVSDISEPYSFNITKQVGKLLYRDQIKLSFVALGDDGFDRASSTGAAFDVLEEPPVVEDTTEDDTTAEIVDTETAGSLNLALVGIAGALLLGLLVAITLGVMLMRGRKEEELGMGFGAAEALGPAAGGIGSVPDYTQLPAGGSYVTSESGQTVYLAPNDTDWTMQADNSFIRSR